MNFAYLGEDIPTRESVLQQLANPPAVVGVDVETVSLECRDLIGLAVALAPNKAVFFPDGSDYMPWHILRNPNICKVFQNCMFDLDVLMEYDVDMSNFSDTMLMANLLSLPNKLSSLAAELFLDKNIIPVKELLKINNASVMAELPPKVLVEHCCKDAQATLAIYNKLYPKVDSDYLGQELQLIPILLRMSKRGFCINQEATAELIRQYQDELDSYKELCDDEGFNPASPKQVAYMLSKQKIFLPYTKGKKSLKTDVLTLTKIDHPIAAVVLGFRHAQKMLSTYLRPLEGLDRVHPKWHLNAVTGRVSSEGYDVQNIPSGIRVIVTPENIVFTDVDFSQIELRVLANMSGDERMLEIFKFGGDIHQATADLLQIPRRLAKTINFAIIYGGTTQTVADMAGIHSSKARELLEGLFFQYPQATDWIKNQQSEGLRCGYVKTLFGRKIQLPLGDIRENVESLQRKAVNYPIQGSAAEIVKKAMLRCAEVGIDDFLIAQVHDELLFDGDVSEEIDLLELNHIVAFETPYNSKVVEIWE